MTISLMTCISAPISAVYVLCVDGLGAPADPVNHHSLPGHQLPACNVRELILKYRRLLIQAL